MIIFPVLVKSYLFERLKKKLNCDITIIIRLIILLLLMRVGNAAEKCVCVWCRGGGKDVGVI